MELLAGEGDIYMYVCPQNDLGPKGVIGSEVVVVVNDLVETQRGRVGG